MIPATGLGLAALALAGCASQGKPPPSISLDEPVQAQPLPEPPALPEPLALPERPEPHPPAASSRTRAIEPAARITACAAR